MKQKIVTILFLLLSFFILVNKQAEAVIDEQYCEGRCISSQSCQINSKGEYCVRTLNMEKNIYYYCWSKLSDNCSSPVNTPIPTSTPASTNTPALSVISPNPLDTTKIVFASYRDGYYSIYTMNSDGTNIVKIINEPKKGWSPSFSPDGKKIVFETSRDGNEEIYIVNVDGSNFSRLTNDEGFKNYNPSFSPDGKKILYDTYNPNVKTRQIMIMNVDGSNKTSLTSTGTWCISPSFSPDGNKIVFQKYNADSKNTEIYMMNVDGSNQKVLINTQYSVLDPSYSPDGQTIVFSQQNDSKTYANLFKYDLKSKITSQLTNNSTDFYISPSFSPDGNKIIFYRLLGSEPKGISIINSNGTGLFNLTENTDRVAGANVWIDLNPDPKPSKIPSITKSPNCKNKNFGDANCDDQIDLQDLEIWICQVLSKSECSALERASDFDLVNGVNVNDFEIWRKNYYKKDIGDKITPVLTGDPKPSKATPLCRFCGLTCQKYDLEDLQKENCPDIMPPVGATCSFDATIEECVVINEGAVSF